MIEMFIIVYNFPSLMKSVEKLLKYASIDDRGKRDILFFMGYLAGEQDPKYASKIVMILGSSGVGKTYFCKKLCELVPDVFYWGNESMPGMRVTRLEQFLKVKKGLLILDDVSYIGEENAICEMDRETKRLLLSILSKVRNSDKLGLIMTDTVADLDSSIKDRIDIWIEMLPPTKESKMQYLRNHKMTQEAKLKLSEQSFGYSFRDIDEVTRLAYRIGRLDEESVDAAIEAYMPKVFRNMRIVKSSHTLKDVLGRKHIKDMLQQSIHLLNDDGLRTKYGLRRMNHLLFHGGSGLGKTYAAAAIAGELKIPMLHIDGYALATTGVFHVLEGIRKFAGRFKRFVVLIDEADKLIGRDPLSMDTPIQGMLYDLIDGVSAMTEGMVILSMNRADTFGESLHDRFTMIEFLPPDKNDRRLYLCAKPKSEELIDLDSMHMLVRRTEGMSYRQLDKIWNSIVFSHISGTEVPVLRHVEALNV